MTIMHVAYLARKLYKASSQWILQQILVCIETAMCVKILQTPKRMPYLYSMAGLGLVIRWA